MKIDLISEESLTEEDIELFWPQRHKLTRRRAVSGLVCVGGLPLIGSLAPGSASAQGWAALARYFFASFSVEALVKLSEEARAWCELYNQGNEAQWQTLDSQLKNDEDVLEDEVGVTFSIPPAKKQKYIVTAKPDSEGVKIISCQTDDDRRSGMIRVTPV
jgi:hypothetical protein